MAQKVVTPPIAPCAVCGAEADCIDWDFNMQYRVMCKNNHTSTGRLSTVHRAVCRWNSAQQRQLDSLQT